MKTVKYATIELRTLMEEPAPFAEDLPELFAKWGLFTQAQEAFWVIAFDAMQQVRAIVEIARGDQYAVKVDIASVMQAMWASGTNRFWVMHNHPSSDIRPTAKDLKLTEQINVAAAVGGMFLEDHIIVGPPDRWYSMVEEGNLAPSPEIIRLAAQGASQWVHR